MLAKPPLTQARVRPGAEPLQVLLAATAWPLSEEERQRAFWEELRMVAVNRNRWDVADTAPNERAFGRLSNTRGSDKAAFPQVRIAALDGIWAVAGSRAHTARLVRPTGPTC